MKKYTILTAILMFMALTVYGQNDTMYVMKNGTVTNKLSIKPADVDSIIFYQPETQAETTVTDADGNIYQTVTIGTQVWMAENLKTSKYNDSTDIPLVTDNTTWAGLTTPGYCWYKDDASTYKGTYGALYNWYTVNTSKLCPTGWHVPSDEEWTTLTTYLGGTSVAGGKLKETGTTHWTSPNTGAINESGFTTLPGGARYGNVGTSNYIGLFGFWWSSTWYDVSEAWIRDMGYSGSNVGRITFGNRYGFSVRCLKN